MKIKKNDKKKKKEVKKAANKISLTYSAKKGKGIIRTDEQL